MKITRLFLTGLAFMLVLFLTVATSCRKVDSAEPSIAAKSINDLHISDGFKFETSQDLGINIQTLDNANHPVTNIRLNIYTDYPDNGGAVILSGVTDINGKFTSDYKVPAYCDSLVVGTDAIGFANMQKVALQGGSLTCILGGKHDPGILKSGDDGFFKTTSIKFYPMGNYDANGVPKYLVPVNDVIDNSMIQDINATLPEYIALPTSHPQYFNADNITNLKINEASNVWVTFVHEGAGYRNVLGYYKFKSSNPPATANDIDSIHIVFPNVSFSGSGGGLTSGNKVYLGTVAPGMEIGWVVIADGFRNGTVTTGNWILYSNNQFNPESNSSLKKHSVLLNDIGRGKFLLSFEDQRRDGTTDNDFNDCIFYVTADPIHAVNTEHFPIPDYTQTDTDGDGVSDNFDDYKLNPTRAFNNYYPAKNQFGTLAFEDLWPYRGDYDLNDMILDYNFNQITNSQNKVMEIQAKLVLRATGASFKNGFGFQLPVASSQIASVTGSSLHSNYVFLNGNGTESGQALATIIAFDNADFLLKYPGSSFGVNTTIGAPYVTPDTLTIDIMLTTPVSISTMGTPPYNPFLIAAQDRGKEVHLVNQPPTSLANMALFGTEQDNTIPSANRYYVTKENLPWAINVTSSFDYPAEKSMITDVYLKFGTWAESSGQTYYDWYKSKSGYRNTSLIFQR